MAVDKLHESDLALSVVSESIIGIDGPNAEPYILPLSGFDRLVQGYPVTVLFVYPKPSSSLDSSSVSVSVLSTIKSALPKTLDHFFPFAGTIVHYTTNGEVICNNTGARLVEASANFSLSQLDFYDLDRTTKNTLLAPPSSDHLLNIQVTHYTCGSFSVSWTFDHQIADAYGFNKLVTSLCDIARTGQPSTPVDHERSFLLRPRSPPTFSALVDRTFTALTNDDELLNLPQTGMTSRHLYIVEGSTLERLRAKASLGSSSKRTRTEALAAYIWKVMARTIDKSNSASSQLGFIVNGRTRMGEDMSSFVGNMMSMAVQEESVRDLKERSLAEVAACVSAAIHKITNRDHFLDVVDWVECHEQGKVAGEIVFGRGVPAIVVNSTHHIPMMSADFGFGQPSLSVMLPTLGWYGPGYVTTATTGRSDGSLFVSLFVSPELAAALESDSDYILRPITLDHLHLS